jgi:hypothetical protein
MIQYPDGFAVWATGVEGERDGASLRVAFKDYAAPVPVLDIQVHPKTAKDKFPTLGSEPKGLTVSILDVYLNGVAGKEADYHWTSTGELAFSDIDLDGVVIFHFASGSGMKDLHGTQWWEIICSFRFVKK